MDPIRWLLTGDPAVAWQAQRSLLGLPRSQYQPVRDAVAAVGWGAALLAARGSDGLWAQGWYSPKWTSTFYTLQTMSLLGFPSDHPAVRESVDLLLDRALTPGAGGQWPTWSRDLCVAGMLIRTAWAFGYGADPRVSVLLGYVLDHQLPDGGWNCRSTRGPVAHSSFHTTLSVLEGLAAVAVAAAEQESGREFLLAHRLFRSHRTGEVVDPGFGSFSFPRYWYYDVLRALEHFAVTQAPRDPRAGDGIALLIGARRPGGTWALGRRHPGRTWLTMETGGQPSRMITLGALRVLAWWEGSQHP